MISGFIPMADKLPDLDTTVMVKLFDGSNRIGVWTSSGLFIHKAGDDIRIQRDRIKSWKVVVMEKPRCVLVVTPFIPGDGQSTTFQRNVNYAKECTFSAMLQQEAPVNMSLTLSQIINVASDDGPEIIDQCLVAWLQHTDVVVLYEDFGVSSQMSMIAKEAALREIPVERRKIHDDQEGDG